MSTFTTNFAPQIEAMLDWRTSLELIRRSVVRVRQKDRFGPIHVELREAAV